MRNIIIQFNDLNLQKQAEIVTILAEEESIKIRNMSEMVMDELEQLIWNKAEKLSWSIKLEIVEDKI